MVDARTHAWGFIAVDDIVLCDLPRHDWGALAQGPDFGSMGLALLEPGDGYWAVTQVDSQEPESAVFEPGSPLDVDLVVFRTRKNKKDYLPIW